MTQPGVHGYGCSLLCPVIFPDCDGADMGVFVKDFDNEAGTERICLQGDCRPAGSGHNTEFFQTATSIPVPRARAIVEKGRV